VIAVPALALMLAAPVANAASPINTFQAAVTTVRTIDKGGQSNIEAAKQVVAKTPQEFAALWQPHNGDKPAPKVDFATEMVVAVFMGSRPTAGFSVEILSAAERGGQLVVTYRERMPSEGAMTAQVLTAPYHIAAIPKSDKPVSFEKAKP
jgi:protease stability complex PrcB-like protein